MISRIKLLSKFKLYNCLSKRSNFFLHTRRFCTQQVKESKPDEKSDNAKSETNSQEKGNNRPLKAYHLFYGAAILCLYKIYSWKSKFEEAIGYITLELLGESSSVEQVLYYDSDDEDDKTKKKKKKDEEGSDDILFYFVLKKGHSNEDVELKEKNIKILHDSYRILTDHHGKNYAAMHIALSTIGFIMHILSYRSTPKIDRKVFRFLFSGMSCTFGVFIALFSMLCFKIH